MSNQCDKCGNPCGPYALCQTHRISRRHGDTAASSTHDKPDGSLPHQCLNCEEIWDRQLGAACPECGATRRKYVGPLDTSRTDDNGKMIVDPDALIGEVND